MQTTNCAAIKYKWQGPWGNVVLGSGAYSYVFKAAENATGTDLGFGRAVAIKKSRSSKKSKRPTLQHETRVLQLLRGHPHIPIVFAYGQLEHFEYMAMEILGPTIAEKLEEGAGVLMETVIRVVIQTLSALDHIHSFRIIHRDIKAGNILCSLEDPSIIKIIDFGIAKPFCTDGTDPELTKYDPLNERRSIVGSLYWASLNSHNGLELSPQDDLESLSFVTSFLLLGNLPWGSRPRFESRLRSQEIIRLMKAACPGPLLFSGFPLEFSELLTYSRSLAFNQLPDYVVLKRSFANLATSAGIDLQGPLDWTPYRPETGTDLVLQEPEVTIDDEDEEEVNHSESAVRRYREQDSYCGMDMWQPIPGERDKDITLPAEQVVGLDDMTAAIKEVKRVA